MSREHFVYPGQPLVLAWHILTLYPSPEAAAEPAIDQRGNPFGWSVAESNPTIPGAGGQVTKALDALLRYREHGRLDRVIRDLHDAWRRTISASNHPEAFHPGQDAAEQLEPQLREQLPAWRARPQPGQ